MTRPPEAILLDVGGVFLLPSHSHIRSALAQVGHAVADDEAIDRAHYRAVRAFPVDLEGDEFMGPMWTEYLRIYASSLDVPEHLTEEAIDHLRNEYVTGWLWSHLIPGSTDGLRALVATGIPIGVVSNSDGTIEARLREMAVLQVGPGPGVEVRCVIDSGTVGVEKPDPAIFEPALNILGVPPEDVWYVGDTPAFDVVGARRAGLWPVLMDPFGLNGDFGAQTVGSLAEVAGLID
jgi:putative hydrolase of the HAD superfamily